MFFHLMLAVAAQDRPLLGFSPSDAAVEQRLEAKMEALINPKDQDEWMRRLTARPHHVGSAYGLENAKYLQALYESWGYDSRIETFYVLFPTPKARLIEMNGWQAKLAEPTIPSDPTGKASDEALPLYNAYSCDGDVTGPLIYVNYGRPEDYNELARNNIDVRGKIVIVRYGGCWRGTKPKVAAEHGAIGCIIYSDPKDDGYWQGDVYPNGPWRNSDGGQRGSVADIPVYPGDPLTPGVGATKDAKRLPLTEAATITKIPVLPIGYGDAQPMLADIVGPMAPPDWRGALPVPYHIGPSAHRVHLQALFNWNTVECRDVIAKIQGSEYPDQWVIRGNHQDAWVYGANDPISGQVAMLSEAKALGGLCREGWHPKRTIVFCSWDGEEPGLLGSTEWVETHAQELSQKAVAYINSDSNSRGFASVEGSHTLERFVNQVLRDVQDPETATSVLDRLRARQIVDASPSARGPLWEGDLKIGALGSGSDFSSFLQHLGIAALDFGYGGEGEGSQYHSTYDSYNWFLKYGDPGLIYGGVLSKTGARFIMRLADAEEIPLEFNHLAERVAGYVKELQELTDSMRSETSAENKLVREKLYSLVLDPTKTLVTPKEQADVPFVNLVPLLNAAARLTTAASTFEEKRKLNSALNLSLIQTERAMLGPGLPGRPWYRHTLYAPGLYTGYGVKTIAGVREALEQHHWKEAEEQAVIAGAALDRVSQILETDAGL